MSSTSDNSLQSDPSSRNQFTPKSPRYSSSSMTSTSIFALGSSLLLNYILKQLPYLFNAYPNSPHWQLLFAESLITSVPILLGGFTLVRFSSYIDFSNPTLAKISILCGRISLITAFLYTMLAPLQLWASFKYIPGPTDPPGVLENISSYIIYSIVASFFLAAISPTWQNPNQPFISSLFRHFRVKNRKTTTQPNRDQVIAEYYKDIYSDE